MAHGITAQDSIMVVRTPAWHRLALCSTTPRARSTRRYGCPD
jgi:hypothetical protein